MLARERARERMLALPEEERKARMAKAREARRRKLGERRERERREREEWMRRVEEDDEREQRLPPDPSRGDWFPKLAIEEVAVGMDVAVKRDFDAFVDRRGCGETVHRLELGDVAAVESSSVTVRVGARRTVTIPLSEVEEITSREGV